MTTHLAMSMFVSKEDYMEARIKELEAALSSAQADREALMEVVRVLWQWNNYSGADGFDLNKALISLPAHLKEEVSK